jgi:hypothetical protein
MSALDEIPILFESTENLISRYSLVFRSGTTSTEDFTPKPSFAKPPRVEVFVNPNPVEDHLQLKVIHNNGEISYSIYSITGVKAFAGTIRSDKTVNTAGLKAGVYVVDAGGVKVKFVKR